MARRFVRSWFTDDVNEIITETAPGTKTYYEVPDPFGRKEITGCQGAYNKPWVSEALAVPIEQMATFNELSKRHGTGARYVPSKDGQYANLVCESRSSRAREMRLRGVFDKDGGYGDYVGNF